MEDDKGLLDEGWQVQDLRSGVAKVYAEAKDRSTMGIRVTAIWATMLLLFGVIDMTGAASVAPPLWDFLAGIGLILLSALAMSRTSQPLLGAAVLCIADLAVVAYRFPEMMEFGTPPDYICAAARVALTPFAIYFIMTGYFGSLSIEAFKKGFSPGADWRTRINPAMMQFVIAMSCLGALVLGVATWTGAIMTGFAQTNVAWITRSFMKKPIAVTVAKPANVEGAATDGKKEGAFIDLSVITGDSNKVPKILKVPETAKPITSVGGMDEFMQSEVEDAFDFAEDSDEAGCLTEAQGRQDRCRDDRCRYWSRVFARACLPKGKKTERFCDGVPAPLDAAGGMQWALKMCAGRKIEDCREMLFSVQGHCHPNDLEDPKPAGAESATAPN